MMSTSAAQMLEIPILEDPDGQFHKHYNRTSFEFSHGLANHPLFELPSLIALARRMPDHHDTYWSNGSVGVTNRWEDGMAGRASLEDTLTHIADNNSIVILKHTEQDSEFAPVLQTFLQRVVDHAGAQMRDDVIVGEVLILVTSPNRVTPYHIDAESNHIVQITGEKTLSVFDQNDRELLTDLELERYYTGDASGAQYRQEYQKQAQHYRLRPGIGVHMPVAAPHWVQNDDNISVTLSVNYELHSLRHLRQIYAMNRRLRRFGLTPTPPGRSIALDKCKYVAQRGASSLRALLGKRPLPPPTHGIWTPV
jgi:hypothetical protein